MCSKSLGNNRKTMISLLLITLIDQLIFYRAKLGTNAHFNKTLTA